MRFKEGLRVPGLQRAVAMKTTTKLLSLLQYFRPQLALLVGLKLFLGQQAFMTGSSNAVCQGSQHGAFSGLASLVVTCGMFCGTPRGDKVKLNTTEGGKRLGCELGRLFRASPVSINGGRSRVTLQAPFPTAPFHACPAEAFRRVDCPP